MAKTINNNGERGYYCEKCRLIFRNKFCAEKCEKWCKNNSGCNIEITNHSKKKTWEN
jgi:hypothetical protein